MLIKEITTDELRRMNNKEGLILQGCGGDLQEWLDGINKILTEEGILLNGSKFETAYATVTLDNQFVINGVKVLENKNGSIFVSMPQIKNSEGKYQDICYPKNSDLRNSIAESVIGEYNAELQLRNENVQSDEIEEQNNSFEPSM